MLKELRVAPQVPQRYTRIHIPNPIHRTAKDDHAGVADDCCNSGAWVKKTRRRRNESDTARLRKMEKVSSKEEDIVVPQPCAFGGVNGTGIRSSSGVKRQRTIIQALSQVAARH